MKDMYKTLIDLREAIKEYEGFMARPTARSQHPTLYRRSSDTGDIIIKGVRKKDFLFSTCEKWILPHNQMGLSFSAHWQHLKDSQKLKAKHNPGKAINVYFVIEGADLPGGMKFVQDKKDKKHYFLTVTEQMTVDKLVTKLKMVAHRMSIIRDAGRAL